MPTIGRVTAPTSVLLANLGSLDVTLATAAEVEAAGVDRVWLAETAGPDPSIAAALIAREHDLEVGTSVVPVWSRTPAVLAAAAADIAAVGRRRPFHLGLGAGGQAIVERWHGLGFTGSVDRMADTIAILARRWPASAPSTTAYGLARTGSGSARRRARARSCCTSAAWGRDVARGRRGRRPDPPLEPGARRARPPRRAARGRRRCRTAADVRLVTRV